MQSDTTTSDQTVTTPTGSDQQDRPVENVDGLKAKNRELLGEIVGVKRTNKELTARLDGFLAEQNKQKEADLAKQGEWQKIAEAKDAELKRTRLDMKTAKVEAAASQAGIVDLAAVKLFVDEVADDLSNIKDVITEQKTAKAYLFSAIPQPGVHHGSAPAVRTGAPQSISQAKIDEMSQKYAQGKVGHADYQQFMSDVDKSRLFA